jgi:methylmalonyl-CoA epimerase
MIKKIHHVGIAVRNLDNAIKFFEQTYGAKLLWRRALESQKVESAFVSVGEVQFELSSSLDPQGVIGKYIESRGEGIHHISLEVDNIDQVIKAISNKGLTITGETTTKDFKLAFVHPQNNFGVLMELYEPKG